MVDIRVQSRYRLADAMPLASDAEALMVTGFVITDWSAGDVMVTVGKPLVYTVSKVPCTSAPFAWYVVKFTGVLLPELLLS